MTSKHWKKIGIILSFFAVAAFALSGCSGSDGAAGPAGKDGKDAGTVTTASTPAEIQAVMDSVSSSTSTVEDLTIASAPVVKFTIRDADGKGIKGLGARNTATAARPAQLLNLRFGIAKLVPGTNGSPSKWVNYIVTTAGNPTATPPVLPVATMPTVDREGALVDNGDGSYTYTFWRDLAKIKDTAGVTDVTYDGTLMHRLVITVTLGTDPASGKFPKSVNIIKHFTINPATKKAVFVDETAGGKSGRDITTTAKCNSCHGDISKWASGPENDGGHFDTRPDVRNCISCHNDQLRIGSTSAVSTAGAFPVLTAAQKTDRRNTARILDGEVMFDMPIMIHKIHNGSGLTKTNVWSDGLDFNAMKYSQEIANCRKCHSGDTAAELAAAPQGNNWKDKPSRLACGSCHDYINWATGGDYRGATFPGHPGIGGARTTDADCILCHSAAYIETKHVRNPAATPKFAYEISEVKVVSSQPVFKFRIMKDGAAVTLATYAAGGTIPLTGFTGGPSFYVAYSQAQDGITAPADFNAGNFTPSVWTPATATAAGAWSSSTPVATTVNVGVPGVIGNGSVSVSLTNIWDGTLGSLSARDADGYYTATLGTATVTRTNVPAGATMVTGSMLGSFSEAGVRSVTKQVSKVATGYTGRRQIISDSKCNDCHAQLGTIPNFHSGDRNDGPSCVICHNPNRNSGSWSSNMKDFVHAAHAASKRTNAFKWHTSATAYIWADLVYPRKANNCEACHLAGTYDFSGSAYTDTLLTSLLPSTAVSSSYFTPFRNGVSSFGTTKSQAAGPGPIVTVPMSDASAYPTTTLSPWLPAKTGTTADDYADTFAVESTPPYIRTKNLVVSPITAACFACHDSAAAAAHMRTQGGLIYAPRSEFVKGREACLACHGTGKTYDIKALHK